MPSSKIYNSVVLFTFLGSTTFPNKSVTFKSLGLVANTSLLALGLFVDSYSTKSSTAASIKLPPSRFCPKRILSEAINFSLTDEVETKKIEFDNAEFGIIGLETAFGLIYKNLEKHLSINEIIEKISNNPRKILGLKNYSIEEGNEANLTIFNTEIEWTVSEDEIISKSKNSPFIGEKLKGKALAIYNNNKFKEL